MKKTKNIKKKKGNEDKEDYLSSLKVKMTNKNWTSHKDLKKKLGIE